MSLFDSAIAIGFSLFIFCLGLAQGRVKQKADGFFSGGGKVPWWISSISLFMSFFSVGTFVVWGSIAYQSGVVAISIQMTMALSGILIGLLIAPAWNKQRVLTVAEYLTKNFGLKTQKFYSYLFLAISLFTAGAFLYPVGKIIEVSLGIPLDISIIVLGLLILSYTAVGGYWAVLTTDVLQFIVLFVAVLILIPLSLDMIEGSNSLVEKLPEGFLNLTNEEFPFLFLVAFLIYNTVFIGGNWAYVQRYTSVNNQNDAKKVGLLFGCLYLIAPFVWMVPPMLYRIIAPDLSPSESEGAYLMISQQALPIGLYGLAIAGMIFATASSVNTTINIAAGVITNDLLKRSVKDKQKLRVAKITSAIFGAITIIVALSVQSMGGIVNVVLSLAAMTGAALYLPAIWTLFSKRQSAFSVIFTTLFSLLINAFFKFISPDLLSFSLSRANEMLLGVFVPVLCLTFFELTREARAPGASIPSGEVPLSEPKIPSIDSPPKGLVESDLQPIKIIGIGIFLVGIMIFLIGLFADKGRLITVALSVLIILFGGFILTMLSRRSHFVR